MIKIKKNPLAKLMAHLSSQEQKAWYRYEAVTRAIMMVDQIRVETCEAMENAKTPQEKAKFATRLMLLHDEVMYCGNLARKQQKTFDKAASVLHPEVFAVLVKVGVPKWADEIHGSDLKKSALYAEWTGNYGLHSEGIKAAYAVAAASKKPKIVIKSKHASEAPTAN